MNNVQGSVFVVSGGSLGFSVTIYSIVSILGMALLLFRRQSASCGYAELGGPQISRQISGFFLIFLWIIYVLLSALQSYGHISADII